LTTSRRLLPTSSSHSSSVLTGCISLAATPDYRRQATPVQGMAGHSIRHQQDRVVICRLTTTTDARTIEAGPSRRASPLIWGQKGLPASSCFVMTIEQLRQIEAVGRQNPNSTQAGQDILGRVVVTHVQGSPKGGDALCCVQGSEHPALVRVNASNFVRGRI